MLVRHPLTSIWKKPDPIVPEPTTLSPTSPIERNPMSPKGWKNRDSGGIGLGIVAALGDAPAKIMVGTTNILVSAPVAIASPRIIGCRGGEGQVGYSQASHGSNWADTGFFCGSPGEEITEFSVADFLSHCYLCRKRLHGKDIYMYRGEKAFCSMECRYRQIVSEEFQETCGSEISKAADLSSSAYSGGGRLFFTGIVA